MLAEFAALALTCAPNVAPVTLAAIVRHESRANQYAIGVNRGARLQRQPTNHAEAVKVAQQLIKSGTDFDAGLGQINVRNWSWLGLSAETVFDPCTNLAATETVLSECYRRALRTYTKQQQALRAALSCYNTGDLKRGFGNGYVGKVLAQAGIKVPALVSTDTGPGKDSPAQNEPVTVAPQPSPRAGKSDGFAANPVNDGFTANAIGDGFVPSDSSDQTPTPDG